LRKSAALREMVRETKLLPEDLVMPYFVLETERSNVRHPVASMPGQFQLSPDALEETVGAAVDAGLRSCILFGIPEKKDPVGSMAYAENGIVQQAIRRLKKCFPLLHVITDVCLCEYTSHGHCGLVSPEGEIHNDSSLRLLADTAVSHAGAGADMIAPSDMMDGRVGALRAALDEKGFASVPIMSYAVKYASAYYGPFREAAGSAPQFGDRKSYQMDPANRREALREARADAEEGADILMVKPAGPYLDIIRGVSETFDLPVAAYQVSGEYSMIMSAASHGWIDRDAVMLESLISVKRAGAGIILSYFTQEILQRGILS
jgi:porphobilinogen synthase